MSDHQPLKPPRRTTLYRFYDDDGTLLYIGIAGNPARRFEQHAREKPWWHTVTRITTEHHDSRETAAQAELAAIADENPVHNIIGNHTERPRTMATATEDSSTQRQDRLSLAEEQPFRPDSLVGTFFHSDSGRGWQGCVIAEPAPGIYLVETFSWVMGESYEQTLIPITDMLDWHFYDDHTWMNHAYNYGGLQARWDRERSERSERGDEPTTKPPQIGDLLSWQNLLNDTP